MQGVSPRQQQILALARHAGSVMVDDLAVRFEVTPQTIRKDLNELCDAKLLARTHGGAMLASGVENVAYEARRQLAASEKIVIGQHAARLQTHRCVTAEPERFFEHMIGFRKGSIDVAGSDHFLEHQIVAKLGVQHGR